LENAMQRTFLALTASVVALAGFAMMPAQASPAGEAKPKGQCFRTERIANWATDKDRLIYVKLNTGAVFRVTLANACPGLGAYQTIAFDTNFSNEICEGRRATIITRSGAGPLHCPVGSIRALTVEEAAALPDSVRP
jgi:hypothetical protein